MGLKLITNLKEDVEKRLSEIDKVSNKTEKQGHTRHRN